MTIQREEHRLGLRINSVSTLSLSFVIFPFNRYFCPIPRRFRITTRQLFLACLLFCSKGYESQSSFSPFVQRQVSELVNRYHFSHPVGFQVLLRTAKSPDSPHLPSEPMFFPLHLLSDIRQVAYSTVIHSFLSRTAIIFQDN